MTDDDKGLIILLTEWDKRESKELSPRVAHHIAGHIIAMKANIEAQAAEIERLRALFGRLIKVCEETSFDGVDWNHWVREEDDIEHFRAALGESND